jgi:ribosomal protein S18 acetylase RimI-like enzyme
MSNVLRRLRPPADIDALETLDTGFTTDRVLRVAHTGRLVELIEVEINPPVEKTYPRADFADDLALADWACVADDAAGIAGLAAIVLEAWNRRARLTHLYVASRARRKGLGRALVEAALTAARARGARCLWVETQSVNYAAVRFYERLGFRWCGFDSSLYDPEVVDAREVALYFAHDIGDQG